MQTQISFTIMSRKYGGIFFRKIFLCQNVKVLLDRSILTLSWGTATPPRSCWCCPHSSGCIAHCQHRCLPCGKSSLSSAVSLLCLCTRSYVRDGKTCLLYLRTPSRSWMCGTCLWDFESLFYESTSGVATRSSSVESAGHKFVGCPYLHALLYVLTTCYDKVQSSSGCLTLVGVYFKHFYGAISGLWLKMVFEVEQCD